MSDKATNERFDRLLKAMSEGEPHKVEKRKSASFSDTEAKAVTGQKPYPDQ